MKDFTLNILEHRIDVTNEPSSNWGNDYLGRAAIAKGTIQLLDSIPTDVQHHTFLHEMIHIIERIGQLTLEETEVDALALGFLSFLRNNPEQVVEIMKGKEKGRKR